MKAKFISILIALVATLLVPISPASAASALWNGSVIVIPVGQAYQGTFDCGEINNTEAYFDNGVLPPGLTLDGTGVVSGTPTTPGTYELSGFHCTYNGGYGGHFPNVTLTFTIQPAVTPTPILVAKSLNTQDCSFYLGFVFPATPDNGSVYIDIDNGSGNSIHAYLDPTDQRSSGTLYGGNLTIQDLNESTDIFGLLLSVTGYRAYSCGDTLNVSVGYQTSGAPVAEASVTGVVVSKPTVTPSAGGHPIQKLMNLNNENCEFRILASIPSPAKAGSTKVSVVLPSPGTDQITFTISDSMAAKLIDFTFTPEELASGSVVRDGIIAIDNQISTSWSCGSTFSVQVEYIDLLDNYRSSPQAPELQTDGFTVTPTKPEVNEDPEASITAVQSNLGTCNISIVATVPDAWRPIAIGITSVDSTDWITQVTLYESGSANGVITLNLSFTSTDGIFANVPIEDEDKTLNGTPVCSGAFRAIIDSPVGNLATTTFTLGQTMPTCNAGSILDEEQYRCILVERGFYTTELNSSTPIACPAGMTTSTTASKSINDCYKPIVQNIVGLKTPKALKYKASTNLAIITNTKALATYKIAGPCTAKVANIVTKVKGKKVTTKMLKVTGGKKAGSCQIDFLSPSSGKYLELRKVIKIKVSKTGK
jgi:hypothetical protein